MFRKFFRIELQLLRGLEILPTTMVGVPRDLICGRDIWRPFIGARLPPA